jgi:acyl-CoA reductase-like NAD-dependent aldehyde dehydrogenase
LAFTAFGFICAFGFTCAALAAGACVVLLEPAAMTGAATMEAASNAAEIVFNMVVSSFKGDREMAGRMAGLVDHGTTLGAAP